MPSAELLSGYGHPSQFVYADKQMGKQAVSRVRRLKFQLQTLKMTYMKCSKGGKD